MFFIFLLVFACYRLFAVGEHPNIETKQQQ
jgi:hypothetical protein